MLQKYQIFISSTYTDLIQERQAAVQAILRAGHIPAGMELFSAGNESQLDTIKRWIEDCEIYMLLLGGRYGSIEPISGLSYTEIEYKYALELGKPLFAIIISENLLNEKTKNIGKEVLELENPKKLKEFRSLVLSKTSRFFDNINDIKLSVLESIMDIQNRNTIKGWVKSNEIPDTNLLLNQLSELIERNDVLEEKLKTQKLSENEKIGNYTFEELYDILNNNIITVPEFIFEHSFKTERTLLSLFTEYQQILSIGLQDKNGSNSLSVFLILEVISLLRIYELAEIVKIPSVSWSKYQTSKLGNKFLATLALNERKKN